MIEDWLILLNYFFLCTFKLEINEHPISIISEALGGSNVDNCPHACVAKPCGSLAKCIPNLESYECECNPSNVQCNKAEEVSAEQLNEEIALAHSAETTTDIDSEQTTFIDLNGYYNENDGDDIEEDYYYDYDNDNTQENRDKPREPEKDFEKNMIEINTKTITTLSDERSTVSTTTSPTTMFPPSVKTITTTKTIDPYHDLIEDIESHYLLRGRYLSADYDTTVDYDKLSSLPQKKKNTKKVKLSDKNKKRPQFITNLKRKISKIKNLTSCSKVMAISIHRLILL